MSLVVFSIDGGYIGGDQDTIHLVFTYQLNL